jgi:hypothetical protein
MKDIVYLSIVLLLSIAIPILLQKTKMLENFSNFALDYATVNENELLVGDIYPTIDKNEISNDNASDIWWHYPVLKLGSYEQITNNLKYSDNPDVGSCTPASMCGALYKDKHLGSNYIKQLPEINPSCGTRVGYFSTDKNLLPFKNSMQNILY